MWLCRKLRLFFHQRFHFDKVFLKAHLRAFLSKAHLRACFYQKLIWELFYIKSSFKSFFYIKSSFFHKESKIKVQNTSRFFQLLKNLFSSSFHLQSSASQSSICLFIFTTQTSFHIFFMSSTNAPRKCTKQRRWKRKTN